MTLDTSGVGTIILILQMKTLRYRGDMRLDSGDTAGHGRAGTHIKAQVFPNLKPTCFSSAIRLLSDVEQTVSLPADGQPFPHMLTGRAYPGQGN